MGLNDGNTCWHCQTFCALLMMMCPHLHTSPSWTADASAFIFLQIGHANTRFRLRIILGAPSLPNWPSFSSFAFGTDALFAFLGFCSVLCGSSSSGIKMLVPLGPAGPALCAISSAPNCLSPTERPINKGVNVEGSNRSQKTRMKYDVIHGLHMQERYLIECVAAGLSGLCGFVCARHEDRSPSLYC